MTTEEIAKKLSDQFKGVSIEVVEGAKNATTGALVGDAALFVPAEKILEICKILKTNEAFAFDCLSSLTAVDRKDRFEMVYHLFSYKHRHSVILKVNLPRLSTESDLAHIETLEVVWGCANWLEREVFDLFGIKFDHHSDLRRIMLPDDWIGYPLRKDYKEQEDYHGISTTRPSLL